MVRTLHFHPLQGTRLQSAVGELRSHKPAVQKIFFSPSFQKLNNQLYMCMYTLYTRMYTYITHTLFIHYSSINELFLQKKFQEVELLDLFFFFWDCCIQFSIVAASIYIFHQQCMTVSFKLHPCQHLLLVTFLMAAILRCVRWYLFVVSVCISLMMSDFEHLSMCLLEICMSSLENVYTVPLPVFKLGCLVFWCWAVWVLCNVLDINSLSDISFAVSSFIQ